MKKSINPWLIVVIRAGLLAIASPLRAVVTRHTGSVIGNITNDRDLVFDGDAITFVDICISAEA